MKKYIYYLALVSIITFTGSVFTPMINGADASFSIGDTIDLTWGNNTQETPIHYYCPVTYDANGRRILSVSTALTNYGPLNATGVNVGLHAFSFSNNNPAIGNPGIPSWLNVTVGQGTV